MSHCFIYTCAHTHTQQDCSENTLRGQLSSDTLCFSLRLLVPSSKHVKQPGHIPSVQNVNTEEKELCDGMRDILCDQPVRHSQTCDISKQLILINPEIKQQQQQQHHQVFMIIPVYLCHITITCHLGDLCFHQSGKGLSCFHNAAKNKTKPKTPLKGR